MILTLSLCLLFQEVIHAQHVNTDSLRAAMQQRNDSLRAAQKQRADSLKKLREYRNSKHYKDSVATARKRHADSLTAIRKAYSDSLRAERQKTTDSLLAVRRHYNDSLRASIDSIRAVRQKELDQQRAARQAITDSIKALRTYQQSKPYKDSVAAVRKAHLDSVKAVRKHTQDSIRQVQQASIDSMRAAIKKQNDELRQSIDSMRAVRKAEMDSLAAIRKIRADSLAQIRAEKEAERKIAEKQKEEKKKLKLELEMSEKKENYSNESMRYKRWGFPRKQFQNLFTRYNYYFNANKKMEEARVNMVRSKTDNYDSLITLLPFDPDQDSAKLKSDMDTILQKAALGIQIHDPRSKWQDDLYLLVGQAYYYKGDYKNAESAFKFIVAEAEALKKEKNKGNKSAVDSLLSFAEEENKGISGFINHESSKNDALLWLIRTLNKSRKEAQAQMLVDVLSQDPKFPKSLKGRLALEKAAMELRKDDFGHAVHSLALVSADKKMPFWQRQRAAFIAGQLYQNAGDFEKANKHFNEVVALHPGLDMDFYAKKNIVTNSLHLNNEGADAMDVLKKMLSQDKYRPYFDQLYYEMSRVNLQENDNESAIRNLKSSIQFVQNNTKQKGISYASLGDIHYNNREYNLAKSAYDSASMFLGNTFPDLKATVEKRANSLSEIAYPGQMAKEADSLLTLASMTEKEQWKVIRDYISDWQKRMADSATRAANLANQQKGGSSNFNKQGQSWYFSNASLMQQGEASFKQKWGNRKLQDNWRVSISSGSYQDPLATTDEENQELKGLDPDSLFAAIPKTPEQIDSVNKVLENALFILGKAFYNQLNDYPNTLQTFDTLEKRYPKNPYADEVLYIRYIIAMRLHDNEKAAKYLQQLSANYPNSQWNQLIVEGLKNANGEKTDEGLNKYYDETYRLVQDREYKQVLVRIRDAQTLYKNQGNFKRKFDIVKAMALVGIGDPDQAEAIMMQLIQAGPKDEIQDWAERVLAYIKNGPASTVAPPEPAAVSTPKYAEQSYTFNAKETHYVLLIAPADLRIFALRAGLIDYNLQKANSEELQLTLTNFTPKDNLILFKQFENSAKAKNYITEVSKAKALYKEFQTSEYKYIIISESNYPIFLAKKNLQEYLDFIKNKY